LLHHAFESWKVHRVTLKTDARSTRSRRAIERLGAAFEGIRRADKPDRTHGARLRVLFDRARSALSFTTDSPHASLDGSSAPLTLAAPFSTVLVLPTRGHH
jgi:hypothetical protein